MLERYDPRNWPISYDGLIHTLIVLGGAVVIALIAHWLIFAILRRLARASESTLDDVVVETVRRPLRWAAIAFAITAAAENDALVGRGWDLFAKFLTPAVIGWVAYAVVRGLARGYEAQIGEADDPVAQRGRLTRIAILSRTVKVGIIIPLRNSRHAGHVGALGLRLIIPFGFELRQNLLTTNICGKGHS